MAWMTIDVALLTAILGLLHAVNSSLVLGYALVIAASGLWNRIRLVWFTTAISMIGYGGLAFETWRKNHVTDSNHYPNIILPALVVLGFLIGQQVRRIRALSPVDIPAIPGRRLKRRPRESPRDAIPRPQNTRVQSPPELCSTHSASFR